MESRLRHRCTVLGLLLCAGFLFSAFVVVPNSFLLHLLFAFRGPGGSAPGQEAAPVAPESAGSVHPDARWVLSGPAAKARVADGLAGRLMDVRRPGGPNRLWTAPEGMRPDGGWRNHGGEKTWVGDMETWRGFDPRGRRWPPPSWFDQDPFRVVAWNAPTNLVLRQGPHASGDWLVGGLERDFRIEGDALVVREALLPPEGGAGDGSPDPVPDDPRRIWSVSQVPFAPRLAVRLCGAGRLAPSAGFPAASARHGAWVEFDLSAAPEKAALAADADALAVEGSDGWLVVSQRSEGRFLAGFASPGRALVYTTGARPDAPAEAYTELEFVALGPRAAHEIVFRILPPGVSPWDAE